MNEKSNKETTSGRLKSAWNSSSNVVKLIVSILTTISLILGIIISYNILYPPTRCEIDYFYANPDAVESGESFTLKWCVKGATKVTIEPGIGEVESRGALTLSPSETTTYEILALNGDGEEVGYCTVTVEEIAPEIKTFEANPKILEEGEFSVLSWSTCGCSEVLIEPDLGSEEPSGTKSVSPSVTTTYKLTISDDGTEEVDYCTVVVKQKELDIESFKANPKVIEAGVESTLSWSVSGASRVTIEPDIGPVESSGTLLVSPSKTTVYTLTAYDDDEESEASCAVSVVSGAPEIKYFKADPDEIEEGESSTLSWSVSGCSEVLIEPEVGSEEPSGTSVVSPSETTTYKLTAYDGGTKEVEYCTVTVEQISPEQIKPDIEYFKADPDEIEEGESSTLSWSVSGCSEVLIEPEVGSEEPSGTSVVSPSETTTYKLTAYDGGTKEVEYCTVKVIPVGNGAPDIEYFEADPDVIDEGGSSTLSWSVSGASQVTIEPDLENVDLTDSRPVSPGETTTYTLEAVDGDETITDTAKVRVLYTAEYEQVNYAYQGDDWYGKGYTVVELPGEKYVPLKDTSRNKLARLLIDDAVRYTVRSSDVFDLGSGYALEVKQIDVDGSIVWLEFTKDGKLVEDKIVGTDSTWEVKLNNIESELGVVVMRVHVNQIFQGQVDSIYQIEGVWSIDYDDAFTLQTGEELPDNMYYVWEFGYDYIKYTEV